MLKREFRKQHPKISFPTRNTVKEIINKFDTFGTLDDLPRSGRPKSVTTDEKIEEVRILLEDNPGMSLNRTRKIANVSYGSAHAIAKSILNLYPYKIQIKHELKPIDFERRKKFAKWFLSHDSIEYYMTASDEAYFHLNGTVNNHNFRIWSKQNPGYVVQKGLFPKKVLVWCGMSRNKIIGPYFFDSTVNNENYLDMLENFFWVEHSKQKDYKSYYFQQDGAPAHKHEKVQDWLKVKFGDRFVDKDLWPSRSPDLNPCDFFLWGYIKDQVYRNNPKTIEELKEAIKNEIKKVSKVTLYKVFQDMKERLKNVLNNDGKHVE